MRKLMLLAILVIVEVEVWAQNAGTNACSGSRQLGCLIPNLYGPTGFTLPNPTHSAHFTSAFQENFTPLTAALATELSLLPLASPASGFTYTFNRATGTYTRSAESFGPILSDRAETIGRGRFYGALTYQRFSFSEIDGIDLDRIPAVFQHVVATGSPFERDFVTTTNDLDFKVDQFTFLATVGVTNRFDISVAVPVLHVSLKVSSDAVIHRTAPPDPVLGEAHFFDEQNRAGSTRKVFAESQSASGLSDVTFRFKATAWRGERTALAFAADVRVPSGDERDFLGSGTWGVKPFVTISSRGRLAPHVNVGYGINGKSVLSGDIAANRKGHLPNSFFYAVGVDTGLTRDLTLAFDLLGQRVFGAHRVFSGQFTASVPERDNPGAGPQSYPQIRIESASFNITSGSTGLKWNLLKRLLVTANLLMRIDSGGLVARVTPLVGVSYTF